MHETKRYRTRASGPLKTITRVDEPREYVLSWGVQQMPNPHYQIEVDGEPPYGCAVEDFHATHVPVEGGWIKSAVVDAYECVDPHDLQTVVRGHVEVSARVEPGMWVVINPGGERYAMPPAKFHERYESAD